MEYVNDCSNIHCLTAPINDCFLMRLLKCAIFLTFESASRHLISEFLNIERSNTSQHLNSYVANSKLSAFPNA